MRILEKSQDFSRISISYLLCLFNPSSALTLTFYTLHRLVVFGVPAVRAGGLVYVAVRCGAVLGLVDKLGDALTVRAGGFWQVFAGFAVLLMGSD